MKGTKAIDLFAGLGGFTAGALLAGVEVVWAANHWSLAVDLHRRNHPEVAHVCQDLHQADWTRVPAHDLLLASPCCQGHTRARGKERTHHDASRSAARAVVSAAEFHRPEVLVIENVPEFLDWTLYPAWADALARLGYALAPVVIDAADCGVPQHRKRIFVVGTRSRTPLVLPKPREPHVGSASFIDFEAGKWSQVEREGRASKTLARVAESRRRIGDRFVVSYYGATACGRGLDRPIGTITTRDRWAVVDGGRMRMLSRQEARAAMSFPAGYALPATHREAIHLLGNAVPPVQAAWVIRAALAAA